MDLHIEKACAGLRALAKYNAPEPDYFLYIGDSDELPSHHISSVPVITTSICTAGMSFGLSCEVYYIPCYKGIRHSTMPDSYLKAYEDYI